MNINPQKKRQTKKFGIDIALTITTGRVLCPVELFFKALSFMTGGNLNPYSIGRARVFAAPILLEEFPILEKANLDILDSELTGMVTEDARRKIVLVWLSAFVEIHKAPIELPFTNHQDSFLVLPDRPAERSVTDARTNELGAPIVYP